MPNIGLKYDWKPGDYWDSAALNRIENWTVTLSSMLENAGYEVQCTVRVAAWKDTDIVDVEQLNRIRQNIQNLKDGFFAIPEWRDMILGNYHDFVSANAMEFDLQMCYNWLINMQAIFVPSGIYSCGGVMYYGR